MNTQNSKLPRPLGLTLITQRAKGVLHPQEVLAALYRHSFEVSAFSTLAAASGVQVQITTAESATIVSIVGETDFSSAGGVDSWVCGHGCRTCG
jgi:hypothetical protein